MQRDVIQIAVTDPMPAIWHNIIGGQTYQDGEHIAIINPETDEMNLLLEQSIFPRFTTNAITC